LTMVYINEYADVHIGAVFNGAVLLFFLVVTFGLGRMSTINWLSFMAYTVHWLGVTVGMVFFILMNNKIYILVGTLMWVFVGISGSIKSYIQLVYGVNINSAALRVSRVRGTIHPGIYWTLLTINVILNVGVIISGYYWFHQLELEVPQIEYFQLVNCNIHLAEIAVRAAIECLNIWSILRTRRTMKGNILVETLVDRGIRFQAFSIVCAILWAVNLYLPTFSNTPTSFVTWAWTLCLFGDAVVVAQFGAKLKVDLMPLPQVWGTSTQTTPNDSGVTKC
jgi:hypothetical protein